MTDMSLHRLRLTIITLGFTAPIVVLGIRFAMGLPATLGQSLALVLPGCVPAIVAVTVFRGPPPRTIGQVLYDTDQASPDMIPIPMDAGRATKSMHVSNVARPE